MTERMIHRVIVKNPKGKGTVTLDYETEPMVSSAEQLKRWLELAHPKKEITIMSRPANE